MIRFADRSHCHWTYEIGQYRSFLAWPTREAAIEATEGTTGAVVYQVHAADCTCEDTDAPHAP